MKKRNDNLDNDDDDNDADNNDDVATSKTMISFAHSMSCEKL